ncbi:hypothetical protein JDV02_007372 [Purpureocillium takamizusanense]|uniref:Uncharacterized protein n=1 Tax=Purpureocillium takamizusanense TaxID=2060973 RepID=A0A9Q8VE24_9HYPO|nr:uncharacterized protein JDV02_007372 [Purpureocillium takamizusanense]UNI21377.1 hypothetical protein JDV02_007372 [Purpureocillium takamizusanense]
MDPTLPLTADEKRFILAEAIKVSPVDVEALAAFVRANNIPADLMHMHLPQGRNMKQCLQLLNQLGIPSSMSYSPPLAFNNPRGTNQSSPPRFLTSKTLSPPKRPSLAYIAPRPSNGAPEGPSFDQRDTSLRETRKTPKKRGRPSKADMAKRDLKPMLPQLIAPRPAPQVAQPPQPVFASSGRAQQTGRSISPAATSYSTHSTPSDDSRRAKRRRRTGNSAS